MSNLAGDRGKDHVRMKLVISLAAQNDSRTLFTSPLVCEREWNEQHVTLPYSES